MLKLALSREEPLSIHVQVSEQFRHQIEDGTLPPGSRLPPVRELAAELGINYNTVRFIYAELERGGYIVSEQGRGTFVAPRPPRMPGSSSQIVREMVDDALARAIMGGISAAEFARMTYTRAKLFRRRRRPRVLFTECNETELKLFGGEVGAALGGMPDLFLFDDLRGKKPAFFDRYDVLVTTFVHLGALTEMAGRARNIVGLTLEPDYRGVVTSIFSLPPRSKIGLVCSSQFAAEHMMHSVQAAGLRDYRYIAVNPKTLHRLKGVKRTYVSRRFLAEHGAELLPPDAVPFETHVTAVSLRYLRQQVEAVLRPEQAVAAAS
jgi:DNA-binding transcriptional regulator YhcF (GntR family)